MSAMLEAFDTQMVDFQTDSDYIMQLPLSDPWSQEEAIMEDDGHTPLQTTIEVDMEPYDEAHQPEYEMEDDLDTDGVASNDVHDVEVYDASRFQSPDVPDDGSPIVNSTQPLAIKAEDTEPPIQIVSTPKSQKLGDSTFQELNIRSPALHQSESSISLATEEPSTAAILETESHFEGYGLTLVNDAHDSTNVATEGSQTEPEPEVENPGEGTAEEETPETVHVHADPEFYGDELNHHTECTVSPEFEDSTSDPHEISEGVYIDPPPPVLISLDAKEPTMTLFNVPSKSSLDSCLQNKSDVDLVLLLGQFPTLYYEPLSSVFEALRREEYLNGIPGLLTGELLLDAYDLDLIMSEDYTYAHEYSLHDLNVLHDGLNKHGPLRMRLRTVTTRFIDRYHWLQSQIAKGQVTESAAESENSSVNSSTEGHANAAHEAKVESSGKEDPSEATIYGVNSLVQADAPGLVSVAEVGATDTESYQEGSVDKGTVVPEKLDSHDDFEAERQPDHSEDRHYREEESVSVESTTLLVETNYVEPINRDIPDREPKTDKNANSDDNEFKNLDGIHSHADDPNQLNESEAASVEVTSTESTDVQYSDHDVESQILEHTLVPVSTEEKDVGDIDDHHLDEIGLHGDNEKSDLANSVHFDLTAEAEEQNQAHSSANACFEVIEDVLDVHDSKWDDSLDGEGDWETGDDEKEDEDEQSFGLEHEHEHEHDTVSNSSSVTLSSKASFKRSLSEAELEDYLEDEFSTGFTDSKKPRVD